MGDSIRLLQLGTAVGGWWWGGGGGFNGTLVSCHGGFDEMGSENTMVMLLVAWKKQ